MPIRCSSFIKDESFPHSNQLILVLNSLVTPSRLPKPHHSCSVCPRTCWILTVLVTKEVPVSLLFIPYSAMFFKFNTKGKYSDLSYRKTSKISHRSNQKRKYFMTSNKITKYYNKSCTRARTHTYINIYVCVCVKNYQNRNKTVSNWLFSRNVICKGCNTFMLVGFNS
jgi:hypothetical protein